MSKKVSYSTNVEYVRDRVKLLELLLNKDIDNARALESQIDERKRDQKFDLDILIEEHSLDRIEETIVLMLLRYDLELEEEPFGRDLIKGVSKLFDLDSLEARNYLYGNGKLVADGIISVEEEGSTILSSLYSLNEWVIRRILGQDSGYWNLGFEEAKFEEPEKKGDVYAVIEPRITLGEVVLNGETTERIEEALSQIKYHKRIFEEWRGKEKFSEKLTFLFYGPPGTGKTYTAEALANEMNKKLHMVSYPKLMSMWLGNTEKNVERCFREAGEKKSILFFDEADAMLRDRSYMFSSGLYESVNVLLSELDRFEGIVIFTTNQYNLLDKALDRRISFKIPFEPPGEKEREMLWKQYTPDHLPTDADSALLARRFRMTGAQIKNAVLAAMRRGAPNDFVTMIDMTKACEEELRVVKSGKTGSQYL